MPMPKESIGRKLLWMAAGAGALLLAGAVAGALVLFSGVYDVAARSGHTRPVFWVLDAGMRNSVRHHAADVQPPEGLGDVEVHRTGALCFHENCAQCHGAPGIAPGNHAKGLMPIANSLAHTGREWALHEIYWVTRNGIGMTGMPAWEHRLGDRELWAIAAFVKRGLPGVTAGDYLELVGDNAGESCPPGRFEATGDPARGRTAMRMYACHACHRIPGVVGPEVYVGPSLENFASRPLIAGAIANNRENLVRWLLSPQSLRPRTLMPDMGVSEAHASDIAAYLATLD